MGTLFVVLILLVPVLAVFLWWKVYNTPDGERYLKMRRQGPFLPSGVEGSKDVRSEDPAKQ